MPRPALLEPLDRRDHFAAATTADPNYVFNGESLLARVGDTASVSLAVPGPGGRTYLLIDRDEKQGDNPADTCLLTIAAVGPDGTLDAAFGDRGIAFTGRVTRQPSGLVSDGGPVGLLKVDDAGRLYFADATRVMRFNDDGTTDRTFGTSGVVRYASEDRPTVLCDVAPTAGGVLLATYQVTRNTQRFSVIEVGRRASTIWYRNHKGKLLYDVHAGPRIVGPGMAQFARSGPYLVLARIEQTGGIVPDTDINDNPLDPRYDPEATTAGIVSENLVVSRFDDDGRGTDVMTRGLNSDPLYPATIGTERYHEVGVDTDAMLLRQHGRTLTVLTSKEVLRLDLKARAGRRYSLPYSRGNNDDPYPTYYLLADGTVAVLSGDYHTYHADIDVDRFTVAGTPVPTFAGGRTATIPAASYDYPDLQYPSQAFLDSAGRLNVVSFLDIFGRLTDFTLRRFA